MLKHIAMKLNSIIFKIKWRKQNAHNYTRVTRMFPINLTEVGKKTYGVLNVHSFGSENESLKIGNYVSIANNVTFLLGGNHRVDTISTYPFKVKILGEEVEAISKGPIIIEDDVWIGINACILSGVKVGKGAVIGAGSIVTKNVPPYAIVGGNPAKIIKFRFEDEIIEKLIDFNFDNLTKNTIQDNIDFFSKKLTLEDLESELFTKNIQSSTHYE